MAEERREALLQVHFAPIARSHQIPEPLMRDFVAQHVANPPFQVVIRFSRGNREIFAANQNEPEVFHGGRREIGRQKHLQVR